ncbi:MAG: acyl CoA:acetate/3-ketoacid CoA transferase [Clostridiales bacterium]|nr:acyl CoA:acetate/3-ketoacid CoA transferase [Clostridiales bacterium]
MSKYYTDKVVSAAEAVAKIPDGAFIGLGGVNASGVALEVIDAIVKSFKETGHPGNLGLIHSGGNAGTRQFAPEGLLGVYYGGFANIPDVINKNNIPAYSLTQGVCNQLFRAQAGDTPCLSKSGLHTYLDPRQLGGALNEKARAKPIVSLVEVAGEEYLHFKLPPIDVAVIRATTADTSGNLIDDEEQIKHEILTLAMAAHNNGGVVIAQVKNLVEYKTLDAAAVKVPGMLVDYIVLCSDPAEWHIQNMTKKYHPGLDGFHRVDGSMIPLESWIPKDDKLIMARRGIRELWPGCVANVGMGASAGVAFISPLEGIEDMYHMSIELGAVGGVIGGGPWWSTAFNASASMLHQDMFDFINGHGLDITFLSAAEIGEDGSVNVTRFGGRANGSGGFVNIASNTKKVVFMSTHTQGGKATAEDGKLKIIEEGKPIKFVREVEEIAFNGRASVQKGQEVMYITERAVFRLIGGKMTLTEYADGLDVEKDVIAHMAFRPDVAPDVKPMPAYCFTTGPIGLKAEWERLG